MISLYSLFSFSDKSLLNLKLLFVMNGLDVAMIAGITIFVYAGAKRGMAQEILGLTGWVLALLLAIRFGGRMAAFLLQKAPALPLRVAAILSFLLLLIAVRILCQVFIEIFQKLFSPEMHGKIDRLIGAVLGFLKGAFFVSIVVLLTQILPLNDRIRSMQQESALNGHMTRFSRLLVDAVIHFVPQIKEPLQKGVKRFNELGNSNDEPSNL